MAENLPSASPLDGRPAPGLRLAAVAEPEPIQVRDDTVRERADAGDTASRDAPRPWHSACTGKVTWMTVPDREVSQCVFPRGHRGDHRDAGGYPWNEARWAD